MYKICCQCKLNLSKDSFNKCKSRKDGLQTICKKCKKVIYNLNLEDNLNKARTYREQNSDSIKEYLETYRLDNKNKIRKTFKQYYNSNKEVFIAANSKRRASKLKATPPWLTKEQLSEIKQFYEVAKMFQMYTGEEYHVDHIIPLQGDNVCGLHVPWNLQVITAKENLAKSNKS